MTEVEQALREASEFAETPAMWMEVYRWYDTRMLGTHNLLLERRPEPRFRRLESLAHSRLRFGDELLIPASPQPVFWNMQCSLTMAGRLRALLFRVIDVTMTVDERGRQWDPFRVLPEVLAAPSLGNQLPSDLSEFAQVFSGDSQFPGGEAVLRWAGKGCLCAGLRGGVLTASSLTLQRAVLRHCRFHCLRSKCVQVPPEIHGQPFK